MTQEAQSIGDDSLAILVALDDQTDYTMIIAAPVIGPDPYDARCMKQILDTGISLCDQTENHR